MKLTLTLLTLALIGSPTLAAPKQAESARAPASEATLVFRKKSPLVQRAEAPESTQMFERITTNGELEPSSLKNLEEFRRLAEDLGKRGYKKLERSLGGRVFGGGPAIVLERSPHTQTIPAENGEPAYISVAYEYRYYETYVETERAPAPSTLVPSTIVRGTLFTRCPPAGGDCAISSFTVRDVGVSWGYLPSGRGADSSAGGAGSR